jgi:hypothetical protein
MTTAVVSSAPAAASRAERGIGSLACRLHVHFRAVLNFVRASSTTISPLSTPEAKATSLPSVFLIVTGRSSAICLSLTT